MMMFSATATTATITNTPSSFPQPPESLASAASAMKQKTAPASQGEHGRIPAYTKEGCMRALRDMSAMIATHQDTPQWRHFASQPMVRLICEASTIGQQDMQFNHEEEAISLRAANQLHELIMDLKDMLRCPLSRQPMTTPVMDPWAADPFRLAFEKRHMVHFYDLQRQSERIKSTDLCVVDNTSGRLLSFEPHPFINALCGWLRTHFPETSSVQADDTAEHSHAVALNTLPTHLGLYSLNIAITGEAIADIELEESQKQDDEQHAARMQAMAAENTKLAETRVETERLVKEQTERVMREIQDLKQQCEGRCSDLNRKNLGTEARLAQQVQLRADLENQVNVLQGNYWNKIAEYNLATSQLMNIRSQFTHLSDSHKHAQQELATTKTQFSQAQQQYNSALSSASNERYSLQRSIDALQSDVSSLWRRNEALNKEVRQARNSHSGGWDCVIQ